MCGGAGNPLTPALSPNGEREQTERGSPVCITLTGTRFDGVRASGFERAAAGKLADDGDRDDEDGDVLRLEHRLDRLDHAGRVEQLGEPDERVGEAGERDGEALPEDGGG